MTEESKKCCEHPDVTYARRKYAKAAMAALLSKQPDSEKFKYEELAQQAFIHASVMIEEERKRGMLP